MYQNSTTCPPATAETDPANLMQAKRVLIIGGTGFLGRHLANRLSARGVAVRVPTRRLSTGEPLLVLPSCDLVEADVFEADTLQRLMRDVDVVVNLVGVLHSPSGKPYGPAFKQAHVELPRRIVAAAQSAGVQRLIHISALGAAQDGPSEYQRSKADGEAAIRAAGDALRWTIFRPSVVFGPEDRFLNLFAGLAASFPLIPLGGAGARFQPVFVGDVSRAIIAAIELDLGISETHELAGPDVWTLAQLVDYAARLGGHRPLVVPLPRSLAMLQATVLSWLPGGLMSPDNVRSMDRDNVASSAAQPFGLAPTALDAVAPSWLGRRTQRGRYARLRSHVRRNP